MILQLHREALDGLSAYAGNWRPAGISIEKSEHSPIGAHLVPERIEEMCDYVNDHWHSASAIHLAAYILWRLNWIHPFTDGNGRTARAISYLILCLRAGVRLPGTNTIPDQIVSRRDAYYQSLEAADRAEKEGRTDVSSLEELIENMLGNQLYNVFERAKGIGD